MTVSNHPLEQYQGAEYDELNREGGRILMSGNIISDVSCDESMTREQVLELEGRQYTIKRHLGQVVSIKEA